MSETTNETTDLSGVSGLALRLDRAGLALEFGPDVVHPEGQVRRLDDVRSMLSSPEAPGPDHLYTIYMGICTRGDLDALRVQGLLYGAVVYNHGHVGKERLRSQGHIHSLKRGTDLRYSEVYEFWTGHGFVYLQKECAPDVSRALLVPVGPGDKVIVPLGWVHLTIAARDEVLSFGAWCAADNELEYAQLAALGGPAHFLLDDGDVVVNPRYRKVADVETVRPEDLPLFGIPGDRPIYSSWEEDSGRFEFLPRPELVRAAWDHL